MQMPLSGEDRVSEGEHSIKPLDIDQICSVCGYQVLEYSGDFYVSDYDEHGEYRSTTTYHSDGSTYHDEFEYVYDDEGRIVSKKTIRDENGETFVTENKYTYDENGYLVLEATVFDDGSEESTAREITADGRVLSSTEKRVDGTWDISEYNEQGYVVRKTEYLANGKPACSYEYLYEYDENGQVMTHSERYEKYDEEGVLAELWEYSVEEPAVMPRLVKKTFYYGDEGYQEQIYGEDGKKTVISYDGDGNVFDIIT